MMNLHGEIINIQIDNTKHDDMTDRERLAYKVGHRDARHAAAELSYKAEKRIRELEEALGELLASHKDFTNCARNPNIGSPDLRWSEDIEERTSQVLDDNE